MVVSLPGVAPELKVGESVALSGACLTVTEVKGDEVSFDVTAETLSRTTLGSLRRGERVNVERAVKLGERLGGHLVQGHVDGVGRVSKIVPSGGQHTFWFEVPEELSGMLIAKGSVAVDGISLTVAEIRGDSFSAAIIPHTLKSTTLGERRAGERVNIEVDLIGKWIRRLLEGKREGITLEKLKEAGFE